MDQNASKDDSALIAMLQRDPEGAMPHIFRKYYEEVCRHIYRLIPVRETCEDIAQSLFLELWKKRGDLDIRTSLGGYLHKMAVSRALNHIRDNQKHLHDSEDQLIYVGDGESSPLQELTNKELLEVVQAAIDTLPARCRQVFMLSRFEEMSYKEISRALDISPKTVENQIAKALVLLRSAVQAYRGGKPK